MPNSGGIGPARRLALRDSPLTRPAASVVTPCHSSNGAAVFQFVLNVQFAPPVAS